MSKAALVSFSIDLKLTPDGQVKILEFGDMYRSGYSGYVRLADKMTDGLLEKCPVRKTVFPFYDGFGPPVYQNGGPLEYWHPGSLACRMGILPLAPRPDFNAENLASHAAILTHPRLSREEERQALRKPPFNQVLATNVNSLVNACCEDKAILAAFAQKFAPGLFPKQKVYPVGRWGGVDIARILADFRDSAILVFKNTMGARAEGVNLVRRSRLNLAFNAPPPGIFISTCSKEAVSGANLAAIPASCRITFRAKR